ncbi:trehalose-6-phosphate synthase [Bradyrhizobium sp. CCGUVB23]|uniref:alpha,alpha-trehalose-phosphate synthase (UDP-forming) n=1 Tax=Bradyrhizobium sp. CCGUVB23 TaxID=2949630 RepID=UPI0020B1FB5C|nr:trehalose-6-phosphate synthase [Bradyrhizobium sp. CCGUVB23]MCP3460917.1 trehalose-6-phosphate synthase [Bradyrhizobium sp. CCGUVB23]
MDRISDTLNAAASVPDGTLYATEQHERIDQAVFDQQLSAPPPGQEPQGDTGPAGPGVSVQSEVNRNATAQQSDMKLVVISNRVSPFDPTKAQTGGLAAALEPVVERSGAIWIGSSDKQSDKTDRSLSLEKIGEGHVARLDLPAVPHRGYYRGFSNSMLWPVLHSLADRISGEEGDYESYRAINDHMAHVAFNLRDRDAFWVHDYHLIPLAADLHKIGVDRPTGFFLHTPWPTPDMIERVPNHRELMKSMLEYDLIGFQTKRDVSNFLACLKSHLGLESKDGVVLTERGQSRCQNFPISIDPKQFTEHLPAELPAEEEAKVSSLLEQLRGPKLAIGVDRLEYTKGIDKRVEAFNHVLTANPGSISLLQIAPPSRADIEAYQEYSKDVEKAIDQVNTEHSTDNWKPIHYKNESFSQAALARLYRAADVGVVAPLADGMNLVAKEYVAAQDPDDPGVLVLSKFAGAAEGFNEDEALLIDPNRPEDIAAAISKAAEMPRDERIKRWRSMMDKLEAYTIHDWAADYLAKLDDSRVTLPADHFPYLGLGWTNESQMPLYPNYSEAAVAYAAVDPADVELKQAAYANMKTAFDELAGPLTHTQDRLWVLPNNGVDQMGGATEGSIEQ